MPHEQNFQREVIDRLARIETKQDSTIKCVDNHSETICKHSERITAIEQSTKAAHHRIDGIYYGASVLGGIAGTVVNFIVGLFQKGNHIP